jgi:hypothetical protein
VRTIASSTTSEGKTTLTLTVPLERRHFAGDLQISDDYTQRVAVEVALLSRNIKIYGDENS